MFPPTPPRDGAVLPRPIWVLRGWKREQMLKNIVIPFISRSLIVGKGARGKKGAKNRGRGGGWEHVAGSLEPSDPPASSPQTPRKVLARLVS